jgi:hypothetical protein
MKNPLVTACLLIISLFGFEDTGFAQKKICSCLKVGGRTCSGTLKCAKGCSAICGRKDTCYLACSVKYRLVGRNLDLEFSQKTSREMAATLAAETGVPINFEPYSRGANELYDYKLVDSGIWKLLEFLDKRGTLVVNGIDFERLRQLKKTMKDGGRLARVRFNNTSVEEAVLQLEIMTGEYLRIVSGDSTKRIRVNVRRASLPYILETIRRKSGVRVTITATG